MITVYSRTQCQYCDQAKRWLETRNINYREINIDHDSVAREFLQSRGHRSVPQFYIGDRVIAANGWSDLQRMTADDIMRISLESNQLGEL